MKNILILSILMLILNGCGSTSVSESYSVKKSNGNHYDCPNREAFDDCAGGDCRSCKLTNAIAGDQVIENDNTSNACQTNDTTVTAKEGTKCIDNGNTLECKNGKVTFNGSITGTIITISGITYKCE